MTAPRCEIHGTEQEQDDGAFFCLRCDESGATGIQYEVVTDRDAVVFSGVPSYEEAEQLISLSRRTDLFIVEVTREFVPRPHMAGSDS